MESTRPTTPFDATTSTRPTTGQALTTRIHRDPIPNSHPLPQQGKILAWLDDPMSGLKPIERPVPVLAAKPLSMEIALSIAPPPGIYRPGSTPFRYWTTAEALRRCADFWGALVPPKTWWRTGPALKVYLDAGIQLNASYTRNGLLFYHQRVAGQTVYSGESPDVASHELGHGILDALRPQLWSAASIEAAAFHEAFGDISAVLTALQLDDLRKDLLQQTAGRYRSSSVSRLAEQLGWAIRQLVPDDANKDCLRDLVNSFHYSDPHDLPWSGPASTLSGEPHSFSRVFSGAFFESLCLIISGAGNQVTEEDVRDAARESATLLIDAVKNTPIVVDYFSQLAAHMIAAASAGQTRARRALQAAFTRRGILTLEAERMIPLGYQDWLRARAEWAKGSVPPTNRLPLIGLPANEFGLGNGRLLVEAAAQEKTFDVTAGRVRNQGPVSAEYAARHFTRFLFERGHVHVPGEEPRHPYVRKTHRIVRRDGEFVLQRIATH